MFTTYRADRDKKTWIFWKNVGLHEIEYTNSATSEPWRISNHHGCDTHSSLGELLFYNTRLSSSRRMKLEKQAEKLMMNMPVDVSDYNHAPKACRGGSTLPAMAGGEPAQECQFCGTKVRDDLVDHPFYGFEADCDDESLNN